MTLQLPLNAHDFFTGNKPDHYVYPGEDGVLTRVPVETMPTVDTATNEIKYNTQVHTGVSTPRKPQIKTIRSRIQVQPTAQVLPPVTGQPPRRTAPAVPRQPSRPTTAPAPRCKYRVQKHNAGCGCGSLECSNPECPLSVVRAGGSRSQLAGGYCRKENCRWFTDVN